MPLVKPLKNEDKNTFINRCVNDGFMKGEYPDKKQRLAVCYSQWDKSKRDNKMEDRALTHNNKIEDGEPAWSKVDKKSLPKSAFANMSSADKNKKSTWSYPHHWVKNGKSKNNEGIFTDGDMYLHRGGLNAAWAAAQGAHTGKKASQEIINHLQKHRKALGLDEKKSEGNDMERRYIDINNNSELRLIRSDGEPTKIVGYFAKFNKMSHKLGFFREIIEPGFFRDALTKSDPVDLFNHDDNIILGRVSANTLRIWEDDIGLGFECIPPDTQLIRDMVLTPIERGDVKGCSFGFTTKRNGDMWDEDEDGNLVRTLLKDGCSRLYDGSQVTFPAYPDTNCALRSMESWKQYRSESDSEKKRLQEEMEKEAEIEELRNNHFKVKLKMKRMALRNR